MNYIYGLSDPRDGIIRYVGKTNNILRRFKQHTNPLRKSCPHCHAWIQKMMADDVIPVVTHLEVLEDDQDWEAREIFWIAHFKHLGNDLTNILSGGQGGVTYGRLGKKNTPEHIAKTSRRGIPVIHTEEGDRKRAEGLRRYKEANKVPVFQYSLNGEFIREWSSAVDCGSELGFTYANISRACKNFNRTAHGFQWRWEKLESIPAYQKPIKTGTKLSEETKKKISQSKKGRPWTENRIKKCKKYMDAEQISEHLALVFKHEIDPSFPAEQQQALNTIHNTGSEIMRC